MMRLFSVLCICFALIAPAEAARQQAPKPTARTSKPAPRSPKAKRLLVFRKADATAPARPADVKKALDQHNIPIVDQARATFLVESTVTFVKVAIANLAGWDVTTEKFASKAKPK